MGTSRDVLRYGRRKEHVKRLGRELMLDGKASAVRTEEAISRPWRRRHLVGQDQQVLRRHDLARVQGRQARPPHRARQVKDNLDKVHDEINAGIRTPATYTIEQCVKDWLDSIERDPHTMATLHSQAKKWIYPKIGSTKLKDFNATDADRFFKELGKVLSKRSLMMIKRRSGDPFAERKFTTSSAGTLSSWLTSQPVSQATHHAP
jgi:hypothetical protein